MITSTKTLAIPAGPDLLAVQFSLTSPMGAPRRFSALVQSHRGGTMVGAPVGVDIADFAAALNSDPDFAGLIANLDAVIDETWSAKGLTLPAGAVGYLRAMSRRYNFRPTLKESVSITVQPYGVNAGGKQIAINGANPLTFDIDPAGIEAHVQAWATAKGL